MLPSCPIRLWVSICSSREAGGAEDTVPQCSAICSSMLIRHMSNLEDFAGTLCTQLRVTMLTWRDVNAHDSGVGVNKWLVQLSIEVLVFLFVCPLAINQTLEEGTLLARLLVRDICIQCSECTPRIWPSIHSKQIWRLTKIVCRTFQKIRKSCARVWPSSFSVYLHWK